MNMVDILFNNEKKTNTRNVVSEIRCYHNSSKSINSYSTKYAYYINGNLKCS